MVSEWLEQKCTATGPFVLETCGLNTHHLDGHRGQVSIGDRRVVALHHVDALPGQRLDDRHVGLERGRLLRLEDEGADPAVELAGQQQADDGRLDVLLVVLVCVEGVP